MFLDRDEQLSGNESSGDGLDAHRASARIEQWLAARSTQDQSHEHFEALRDRMQEIEDKWRGRSPLAAQIMDEIGSSLSFEDMLRHLTRLEEHIRLIEGKESAGAPGTARPRRVVRTLIRL